MSRALLAIVFVLSLGCATAGCTMVREFSGEVLDQERLDLLVAAKTKAEVLERFGPPNDVGMQQNGSVFIYRYRTETLDNLNLSFFNATFDYETTDTRTARLIVMFDKQGRKTGQGFNRAKGE